MPRRSTATQTNDASAFAIRWLTISVMRMVSHL
jgi:hypothetical protein